MSAKLYSYWLSSCSWRVRICLALKKVNYECITVPIVKRDAEWKQKYKQINPMAQVPTFMDGDAVISQSMAIMEYIEENFEGHSLLPKDVLLRAKQREICEIICSGIQPLQNLNVLRKVKINKNEWAQDFISSGFNSLEKVLERSSGKYCVGDDIMMADACLVPQAYAAVTRYNVNISKYPIISRIHESLLENHAFQVSHPHNQADCPKTETQT